MKSVKLVIIYFLLAYILSTVVSLVTYLANSVVMWIAMFTLIPAVFGYFFYLYLKNTKCDLASSLKETNLLIAFWISASLLLDYIVYMVIVSLLYGYHPLWVFFTGHPLWLCLDYVMIIIVGYISRYIYIRKLKKS